MGVTSDHQLVITIGDEQAGGTSGQLVLDSVEMNQSRDNDPKHGVGNDTPQGMQLGNIEYEATASAHLNGAAADLARNLEPDTPISANFATTEEADGEFEVKRDDLYWNEVNVEAQDGGDVVLSLTFDAMKPSGDLASSASSAQPQ